MKRKVMLVAVAVILCSLVIAGGTLAYTTFSGRNTNRVSTGQIAITLSEVYEKQEGLAPNPDKLIEKKVWVTNDGSGDAYVRVQVEKSWNNTDGRELTTGNIGLNINGTDWQYIETEQGAYYYYKSPLKPGEETALLMDGFYFLPLNNVEGYDGPLTDNDYKGLEAQIEVKAEAVQVANDAVEAVWELSYDEESSEFVEAGGESEPSEDSSASDETENNASSDNE